jgi:hypothetical protein
MTNIQNLHQIITFFISYLCNKLVLLEPCIRFLHYHHKKNKLLAHITYYLASISYVFLNGYIEIELRKASQLIKDLYDLPAE